MPTFNQLVKKGRQTSVKKSTAPALRKDTILLEREVSMHPLLRREAYVQL